jgi:hypothetical protein
MDVTYILYRPKLGQGQEFFAHVMSISCRKGKLLRMAAATQPKLSRGGWKWKAATAEGSPTGLVAGPNQVVKMTSTSKNKTVAGLSRSIGHTGNRFVHLRPYTKAEAGSNPIGHVVTPRGAGSSRQKPDSAGSTLASACPGVSRSCLWM